MSAAPPDEMFVRSPDMVRSAEAHGPAARTLTGELGSDDKDIATIELPSAPQIDGEKWWAPQFLKDYVNSKIDNRVNNTDDPALNVPGIGAWRGFLTWDKTKWDAAMHPDSYPGGVNPFQRDRKYNPYDGSDETWNNAFLGIKLPVSRGPLTFNDILHARRMIAPGPTERTYRYRPTNEPDWLNPSTGGKRGTQSRVQRRRSTTTTRRRRPKRRVRTKPSAQKRTARSRIRRRHRTKQTTRAKPKRRTRRNSRR